MEKKTNQLSRGEACEFLTSHDNYVILLHAQPDGDTIGSGYALAYALKKMGKKVRVLCSDPIPPKFTYISNSLKVEEFPEETVVAVDVASPKLLGSYEAEYGKRVDLCIDHHISNLKYADNLLLDADASANCEIIYKVIKELGVEFCKHIIDGLYTGIVTDNGCFKYSNTTVETHLIAAELMKMGVDYAEINRIMFDTKSRARVKIEGMAMDGIEYYFGGRVAVITVTRKMIEETGCDDGDLDGINTLSRMIEGVMVGVTIREKKDGKYKISLRTNAPIDATAICAEFGGGGHPRAAGCEFSCTLEQVKQRLNVVIKEALEESGCLI